MRVQCPHCGTGGNLPDAKIPPTGSKLTCPKCKAAFFIQPPLRQENPEQDAQIFYQEGIKLFKERHFDAAIEKFNLAIQAHPHAGDAYRYLGLAYGQKHLWVEAGQVLQKALTYQPDNLHALKNLGIAYLQQKKFAEAEQVLQKALQAAPDDAKVKSYLAAAWQGQKTPAVSSPAQKLSAPAATNAEPTAAKMTKLPPDKPGPPPDPIRDLLDKGVDYLDNAQYNSAVEAFHEVIRLAPQRADGYVGLGMVYEKRAEWVKAVEAYEKAVALNPHDSSVKENLKFAQKHGKQKARWKFWGK